MRNEVMFLKRVLVADAAVSGACGLLMVSAAPQLQSLLQLPAAPTRSVGIVLLAYAVFVALVSQRDPLPRAAVWSIVAINVVWVIDSVLLLMSDWVAPNALGVTFICMQAVVVGVFAELQIIGMKRTARALTV